MKMLDLVLVAVIFRINASWLFWKQDVGRYRSRCQNRHKKSSSYKSKKKSYCFPHNLEV